MLPEVRRVLDVIENALLKRDQAAQDIASILSALRGPDSDSDNDERKLKTTCPLRRLAFPRLAADVDKAGFALSPNLGGKTSDRGFSVGSGYGRCWGMTKAQELQPQPYNEDHFENHINLAVDALRRER